MANYTTDRYRTLGLFSFLVLAQIRRNPNHAYAAAINDSMCALFDRDGASPQISKCLITLVENGYIKRVNRSVDAPWAGSRRYYELTIRGNRILDLVKEELE